MNRFVVPFIASLLFMVGSPIHLFSHNAPAAPLLIKEWILSSPFCEKDFLTISEEELRKYNDKKYVYYSFTIPLPLLHSLLSLFSTKKSTNPEKQKHFESMLISTYQPFFSFLKNQSKYSPLSFFSLYKKEVSQLKKRMRMLEIELFSHDYYAQSVIQHLNRYFLKKAKYAQLEVDPSWKAFFYRHRYALGGGTLLTFLTILATLYSRNPSLFLFQQTPSPLPQDKEKLLPFVKKDLNYLKKVYRRFSSLSSDDKALFIASRWPDYFNKREKLQKRIQEVEKKQTDGVDAIPLTKKVSSPSTKLEKRKEQELQRQLYDIAPVNVKWLIDFPMFTEEVRNHGKDTSAGTEGIVRDLLEQAKEGMLPKVPQQEHHNKKPNTQKEGVKKEKLIEDLTKDISFIKEIYDKMSPDEKEHFLKKINGKNQQSIEMFLTEPLSSHTLKELHVKKEIVKVWEDALKKGSAAPLSIAPTRVEKKEKEKQAETIQKHLIKAIEKTQASINTIYKKLPSFKKKLFLEEAGVTEEQIEEFLKKPLFLDTIEELSHTKERISLWEKQIKKIALDPTFMHENASESDEFIELQEKKEKLVHMILPHTQKLQQLSKYYKKKKDRITKEEFLTLLEKVKSNDWDIFSDEQAIHKLVDIVALLKEHDNKEVQ